jgi:hypothetical protein
MPKSKIISNIIRFAVWLTGILVSLAVGFGMINKVLYIMYIPTEVTILAGWVVVVFTLISVVLSAVNNLGK